MATVFYIVNAFVKFDFMNMTDSYINCIYNTIFRFATMLVLSPFIKLLEKLVCIIFKDNHEEIEDIRDIDLL